MFDDRTGHCKFRLDCRTKKAKDGPLALLVHITLGKVRVFPVSIPPHDLPSKKTVSCHDDGVGTRTAGVTSC